MKRAKRRAHQLICALLIFVFVFANGRISIPAASTTSYPTSTESEYNFSGDSVNPSSPGAKIEKSATWTNIEEGEATITIAEQDTAYEVYSPIDYIIVMDRSDSVTLDLHYTQWYGSGWNPQCPCLNPNHYYLFDGAIWYLDSYDFGLCVSSSNTAYQAGSYYAIERFVQLPWNHHYEAGTNKELGDIAWANNQLGENKSLFLTEGCYARFESEKTAAKAFLNQIQAYDNEQIAKLSPEKQATALHSRVAFWAFSSWNHEQIIINNNIMAPNLSVYEEFAVSNTSTTRYDTPQLVTNNFSQYGITNFVDFTPINTGISTLTASIDATQAGGGTYYDP